MATKSKRKTRSTKSSAPPGKEPEVESPLEQSPTPEETQKLLEVSEASGKIDADDAVAREESVAASDDDTAAIDHPIAEEATKQEVDSGNLKSSSGEDIPPGARSLKSDSASNITVESAVDDDKVEPQIEDEPPTPKQQDRFKGSDATNAVVTHALSENDNEEKAVREEKPTMEPTLAPGSKGADGTENDDGVSSEDEDWEMARIMSETKLQETKETGYTKCSYEECNLHACALYVSTIKKNRFYYCIDCQLRDFEGWPEEKELPMKTITCSHKKLLATKCSLDSDPTFPSCWETMDDVDEDDPEGKQSPPKATHSDQESNKAAVTPLQTSDTAMLPDKQKQSSVKRIPHVSPTPTKPKAPSQSALNMHRKWQEAAEAMGGPGARIVVSKPQAKKLIFQVLHDGFRPMNITQIHKELKAVVPSPVLRSCLDDMADKKDDNPFDEDSEDESKSKHPDHNKDTSDTELFTASLNCKAGRSPNTILYYVNQLKQANDGNGLEVDKRNELFNSKASAEESANQLQNTLNITETETKLLLSQPTNEDAISELAKLEKEMKGLKEKLDVARKLKVNEKYKKQVKRRIESMAIQWRKRKRICMDFLIMMEESTDGSITLKDCLKGDGKIDIESDEVAIANSTAYVVNRRKRSFSTTTGAGRCTQFKRAKTIKAKTALGNAATSECVADPDFVGVKLDVHGRPERVFLENDNE